MARFYAGRIQLSVPETRKERRQRRRRNLRNVIIAAIMAAALAVGVGLARLTGAH